MKKICYIVTIPLTIRAFFIPQLIYLSKNGYDVTVICGHDKTLQEELGNHITYKPIDIPRGVSLFKSFQSIMQLTMVMRKEKFDFVQYSTPNAAFCGAIASILSNRKVRNYHLMGYRYEGNTGIARFVLKCIEKITCMLSTNIECVSRSCLDFGVKEKLFKNNKATVVYNGSSGGIDLQRFSINSKRRWCQEIRKIYQIPMNKIVFGFVGRITKDKGIEDLLETFKTLNNDNMVLMLVGPLEMEYSLNKELLLWAKRNPNIVFVGSVKDVEKYYAAMDVLVLPSYREGFGNVLIEAQSMGVCVIASDISGPKDAMIHKKTGLLFPLKNKNELKKCMITLLNKDIREKYSKEARIFVEQKFDQDTLNKYILKRKQELLR